VKISIILSVLEQARGHLPIGYEVVNVSCDLTSNELFFDYMLTSKEGTEHFSTRHDLEELPEDEDILEAILRSINTSIMIHHIKNTRPELQIMGGDYFKNQLYLLSPYTQQIRVKPILNDCYNPDLGKFSSTHFAESANLFNRPGSAPAPQATAQPRIFTPKVHDIVKIGSNKPGIPMFIYQPFILSLSENKDLVVKHNPDLVPNALQAGVSH